MKQLNKKIVFKIAADGSSASGKTTGSKLIAKKFKMNFLSSGTLYRYCALKTLENKNICNPKFKLMLQIPVKEGESIEKALKKYKKKFERTGVLKELRTRKEYIKKSVVRRQEVIKAQYVEKLKASE